MLFQPGIHFLLSRKFSLGSQFHVNGSFTKGLQLVLAEPEMRLYLNPNHPKSNWFIFTSTRFTAYDQMDADVPFQLKSGVGLHTHLAPGLTWQSRLFATFQSNGLERFFEHPDFYLDNKLVYFQTAQRRHNKYEILPRIGRGRWMIGGSSFGFNRESQFAITSFTAQFLPMIGHFFSDRLLVGVRLPFSYTSVRTDFLLSTFDQNIKLVNLNWGTSPLLRFYMGRKSLTLQPFAEARLNLNYSRSSFRQPGTEPQLTHQHSRELLLGGGIDLFLTDHVAFEAGLFLGKNLDLNFSIVQLGAGFQYFLGHSPE